MKDAKGPPARGNQWGEQGQRPSAGEHFVNCFCDLETVPVVRQ